MTRFINTENHKINFIMYGFFCSFLFQFSFFICFHCISLLVLYLHLLFYATLRSFPWRAWELQVGLAWSEGRVEG